MIEPSGPGPELRIRLSGTDADRSRTVWWECPHCRAWGTKQARSGSSALEDLMADLRLRHAHGVDSTGRPNAVAPPKTGHRALPGMQTTAVPAPREPEGRTDPRPTADSDILTPPPLSRRRPRWGAVSGLLKLRPPWAA